MHTAYGTTSEYAHCTNTAHTDFIKIHTNTVKIHTDKYNIHSIQATYGLKTTI